MLYEHSNTMSFTSVSSLLEVKIKAEVSFLNTAPKCPCMTSKISKCIFRIFASLARRNRLKLCMLGPCNQRITMYFIFVHYKLLRIQYTPSKSVTSRFLVRESQAGVATHVFFSCARTKRRVAVGVFVIAKLYFTNTRRMSSFCPFKLLPYTVEKL